MLKPVCTGTFDIDRQVASSKKKTWSSCSVTEAFTSCLPLFVEPDNRDTINSFVDAYACIGEDAEHPMAAGGCRVLCQVRAASCCDRASLSVGVRVLFVSL